MKEQSVGGRNAYNEATTVGEAAQALSLWTDQSKGAEFERLLCGELPFIGETEVRQAWRWADIPTDVREALFPRATRQDTGVDILAHRKDGGWIAIQAKCYRAKTKLAKSHIESFNQSTGHSETLDARWVITTTSQWSRNLRSMEGYTFIHAPSQWIGERRGVRSVQQPKELDKLQQQVFDGATEGFKEWDRLQVKMACGTGKTLTSQRIAEEIVEDEGIVVYATPSIGLTAQSRKEWLREAKRPIRTVVVCSDTAAGQGGGTGFKNEVSAPVTTTPSKISEAVEQASQSIRGRNGYVVIFTTYQSMEKVCEAQEDHGLDEASLLVGDEGHRTTGGRRNGIAKAFQMCHERLKAKKRLYQTATPRVYSTRSRRKITDNVKEERSPMYLMTQTKNGISALDLSRQLGVSYNTAWSLKHKLMQVMKERDDTRPLGGSVQLDDAYWGGEGAPWGQTWAGGAGQDAVRRRGGAQPQGPAGQDAPESRRRVSKRRDCCLGQVSPRAWHGRGFRRLGLLYRGAACRLLSSTIRDRRRTSQRETSGVVLGQYAPGQPQAFDAWQLSPRQLQAPAAVSRRILLSVQPPVLAPRDVPTARLCRLTHPAHAQPSPQAGRELCVIRKANGTRAVALNDSLPKPPTGPENTSGGIPTYRVHRENAVGGPSGGFSEGRGRRRREGSPAQRPLHRPHLHRAHYRPDGSHDGMKHRAPQSLWV